MIIEIMTAITLAPALPLREDGTIIDPIEVSHWEWQYKNSYTTYDLPAFYGTDKQVFNLDPGIVCWKYRPIMIDGNNGDFSKKWMCFFEID